MKKTTPQWFEICALDEIPKRGALKVSHNDKPIALFMTASNEIYALEDRCPHKGGPLSDGIVHGNCVTCPLHNWDISLSSGEAMNNDEGQVATFNVRVANNTVYVELAQAVANS